MTGELERVAVSGRPLLVLSTAEDGDDVAMTLGPLAGAGGRGDRARVRRRRRRLERLLDESAGVPQRIHRAARRWARDEAVRRLGASADRAASERARLRAAEDDLAAVVVELQAASERAEPRAAHAVVACPFKGLASFDVDDADVFFGRERLVAEMVARLAGTPLLGIVGPSGSGKSSVLRAGLLPALAHDVLPGSGGWAIALLRPGAHPLAALEQAVAQASPHGRLVIAVDQFEELFTACRDEAERAAFADALVAAVRDPRRRALVLIALRADFYGRCASYPELWRMLGASHVPVGPMRRDELRRAIVLPAQRAGPARRSRARRRAGRRRRRASPAALPLLSTALLELWQEPRRPAADVRRLRPRRRRARRGGAAGRARLRRARRRSAGRARGRSWCGWPASARATPPCAGACRSPSSSARRARPRCSPTLADGRLVTVSGEEAEVAHEALLREWPRLRGWLEEDVEGRACTTTSASRRASGTRAGATRRALPRRPAGRRARLVGDPRRRARRASSARSSTRAAPRRGAPSAACAPCCSPASRPARRSRWSPGSSRSSSAAPPATRRPPPTPSGSARARSPRTTSTARCCSRARASRSTTARRRAAACSPR